MRTLIYTGPSTAVEIAATGQVAVYGQPIEVEDDLAESLLEQDIWAARGDDVEIDEAHAAYAAGVTAEEFGEEDQAPVTFTVDAPDEEDEV